MATHHNIKEAPRSGRGHLKVIGARGFDIKDVEVDLNQVNQDVFSGV